MKAAKEAEDKESAAFVFFCAMLRVARFRLYRKLNYPESLKSTFDLMHFQEKIQDNFFDFFDCSNLFQKVKSIKFGIIF